MGCDARPATVDSLTLIDRDIMAHDGNPLQVGLDEVAPGEFIISVVWRERTIGSLYLRGDREEATAFLDAARQRIVVAITGDGPADVDRQVQRELVDLSRNLHQPRG